MVHLYRAEVGRANLWRNRLDTTTNWAVVTAGAALTFTFSSPNNPHFVLLLVLLLVLVFLMIEARRYSYYALWYHRARLLETGFFSALLEPDRETPALWRRALRNTLEDPTFITPRWRAAATRYRRNYIWLITLLIISWLLKLSVHPTPSGDFATLISRAAIGSLLPGPAVIGIVVGIYVLLLGLILVSILVPSPSGGPTRTPNGYRAGYGARAPSGGEQLAIIITNRKQTVADRLMRDLERGVTALQGIGMYTGETRDVLLCALTLSQESALRTAVSESDRDAFLILTGARDIRGLGFAPTEPPE
jgi:uncharacterized membrane protein